MATAMVSECSISQLTLSIQLKPNCHPEAMDLCIAHSISEVLRFAQDETHVDDNPRLCREFAGHHASLSPYRRQLPKPRDRFWDQAQCKLYILLRILFSEAEANAGFGAVGTQPHRSQHVRRLDRPRRTRSAGRDCQSLQVQRDDHRRSVDAIEINGSRVGHASRAFAV